jgi:hypothetical protein
MDARPIYGPAIGLFLGMKDIPIAVELKCDKCGMTLSGGRFEHSGR